MPEWLVPRRERIDRVGGGVRHLVERLQRDVVERVAHLVVARVVLLAGRAAEDRDLLGRLDTLGAGEEAAGRYSGGDERPVV